MTSELDILVAGMSEKYSALNMTIEQSGMFITANVS